MTRGNYRVDSMGQVRRGQWRPSTADYVILPIATLRSRIVDTVASPDFVAVAIFCAIGLLVTVNLMLRVPDIGVM